MSKLNSDIRNEINQIKDRNFNIRDFIFDLVDVELKHSAHWKKEYHRTIDNNLKS